MNLLKLVPGKRGRHVTIRKSGFYSTNVSFIIRNAFHHSADDRHASLHTTKVPYSPVCSEEWDTGQGQGHRAGTGTLGRDRAATSMCCQQDHSPTSPGALKCKGMPREKTGFPWERKVLTHLNYKRKEAAKYVLSRTMWTWACGYIAFFPLLCLKKVLN